MVKDKMLKIYQSLDMFILCPESGFVNGEIYRFQMYSFVIQFE